MDNLYSMLCQYRRGCADIQERITRLTGEIDSARVGGAPMKSLLDRRYLLYTELAEMQGAIRSLEEYLGLGAESRLTRAV